MTFAAVTCLAAASLCLEDRLKSHNLGWLGCLSGWLASWAGVGLLGLDLLDRMAKVARLGWTGLGRARMGSIGLGYTQDWAWLVWLAAWFWLAGLGWDEPTELGVSRKPSYCSLPNTNSPAIEVAAI